MQASVLKLFKINLGISHQAKDALFEGILDADNEELKRQGVILDLAKTDDVLLLVDYSAWNYRKRDENIPLSANLKARIARRKTRRRIADADGL